MEQEYITSLGVREFLVGDVSDQELRSALNNLVTSENIQDTVTFADFCTRLNSRSTSRDFSAFGVTDPEQVVVIQETLTSIEQDYREQVYKTEQARPASELDRVMLGAVYMPEEYGKSWGWLRKVEVKEVDYSRMTQDHRKTLEEIARNRAQSVVQSTFTTKSGKELYMQMASNPKFQKDFDVIIEEANNFNLWTDFISATKTKVQQFIDQKKALDESDPDYQNKLELFEDQYKAYNAFVGIVGKYVTNQTSEFVELNYHQQLEYLLEAFSLENNSYAIENVPDNQLEDDEVLSAHEKRTYRSKMAKYLQPSETKVKTVFVYPDPAELTVRIERTILTTEGRYLGERYIRFEDLPTKNPYVRYVPRPGNRLEAPISTPYFNEYMNPNEYYEVRENQMLLFPTFTAIEIENLNRMIDNCLKTGEELIIFVPTCPCDQHSAVAQQDGSVQIEFTGGDIVEGISWTGQNTIDGLSMLVPKLKEVRGPNQEQLRVKVVFATGDMEFTSGNHRGMSNPNEFYRVLDANHPHILNHIAHRIGGHFEAEVIDSPVRNVRRLIARNEVVTVETDGIMEIAGGLTEWEVRQQDARKVYEQFKKTDEGQVEIRKVLESRSEYYKRARNAHELKEGLNEQYEGSTYWHLEQDMIDYIAFHRLALDLYQDGEPGPKRMLLFAGDSRPLEYLASKVTGTFYMGVQGNYEGSKLKD